MDITATTSAAGLHAPMPAVAPDKAAEKRDVVQAVKTINGSEMFGTENELLFTRDPETSRFVVRVVNRKTKELVSQIPEEYVLRLAEDLKKSG